MKKESKHPEWATRHRRKGTELRLIGGKYYLYEAHSKWDPEKKRARKISGKCLGRITEDKGFVESDKDRLRRRQAQQAPLAVRDYGFYAYAQSRLGEYGELLRKHFPGCWAELLVLAYTRLAHQSPLKRVALHYGGSYFSVQHPELRLSPNDLSALLRQVGANREAIVAFFKEFGQQGDHIIFDGTDILSKSGRMGLPKQGKSKRGTYDSLINIMFVYSTSQKLPIYYRLVPGNIKDIASFKNCLLESGIADAVLILDKGFNSKRNLDEIRRNKLSFVVPLKRDNAEIDYSLLNEGRGDARGYFKFAGRYIWYAVREAGPGERVYLFLDEALRGREQADYLDRIKPKGKFTEELFHEKRHTFGTLALLSNQKLEAKDVFVQYKSRGKVEDMIDTFKNVLDADRSHMQDERALEGWMFVNHIALHWYFRIYQMIAEKGLTQRFAPKDFITLLEQIKKIKINEEWVTSETILKTKKILGDLGVDIT